MIEVKEKELFSPDFLKGNPELLEIQEIKIDVDEKLQQALFDYDSIKKQIGEIKTETVLESCKESVLSNLYTKFAVNSLVAMGDKDGGNVTTLHNAKNQIFANEKDKTQFNREYDSKVYHDGNELYRKRKAELEALSAEGNLIDIYTGKNISGKRFEVDINGKVTEKNIFDNEHPHSAKSIHDRDDFRFAYNEKEGADLVNNEKNLGATSYSLNRSKKEKSLEEWKNLPSTMDPNKTNEELYGINPELADKKIKESKQFIDKSIAKAKFKKYSKEVAITGFSEGGKTFLYSAIGQISAEFIKAAFDALIEAFKDRHAKSLKEILDSFKSHIQKAVNHIKSNWKEILANSFEGALINFLNNLLVFAINLVATTLKNVVSMIRAGFTTVCSAIKLLCNPPKEMTEDERNEAVMQILVFGMTEVSAIALNECVENLLLTLGLPKNVTEALVYPLTAFMGGIVAAIILGIIQNARNDAKKSKLSVQLVAQNNVVLQTQITQNWCLLAEGTYKLKEKSESFDRTLRTVDSGLKERAKETEKNLDEIDTIISELRR